MESKVGLELEFMVAYNAAKLKKSAADRKDMRWPEDADTRDVSVDSFTEQMYGTNVCIHKVCETLAILGLPVACTTSADLDIAEATVRFGGKDKRLDGKLCHVWNDDIAGASPGGARYGYWFLDHEAYITSATGTGGAAHKAKPPGYEWYCVEINSPILSDLREFERNLPTVRLVLDELKHRLKIWTSQLCGFHIHVSPSNKGLTLETAKGLTALAWLLEEPIFYKLAHSSRSNNEWVTPMAKDSRIAMGTYGYSVEDSFSTRCINALRPLRHVESVEDDWEKKLFKSMHTILTQADLNSLLRGLRVWNDNPSPTTDGVKSALAMSRFGTFEFRYPEATFDIMFINFWVALVRRLTHIAMLPPSDFILVLQAVYQLRISDSKVTWKDYLRILELHDWEDYIAERLRLYQSKLKDLNKLGILPRCS